MTEIGAISSAPFYGESEAIEPEITLNCDDFHQFGAVIANIVHPSGDGAVGSCPILVTRASRPPLPDRPKAPRPFSVEDLLKQTDG